MNTKSRLVALTLICLILSASLIPTPVVAQADKISVAEFREKFTAYMIWLDNASGSQSLTNQVQAMSDEEFQVVYDAFADPDSFIAVTEQVMTSEVEAEYAPQLITALDVQPMNTLPVPSYPSANVWLTTIPSIFWVIPQSGSWATDGCGENVEGGLAISAELAETAAIMVDIACNVDPTKLSCVGAALLHETSLAANSLVNKCSYIGGAIDSAENHATYEISRIISDQISTHDTEIKAILSANHNEVMDMLAENQFQLLRVEVEQELSSASNNKRISYFYLPQSQGGLLELVHQVVQDTINDNMAAGMSVGNAQSWLAKADASLAKGNYKAAYDLYKKAYLEAVK